MVKKPVTESQSEKVAENQSDKMLLKMTQLFQSVEMLGPMMDSSVKTLENKVKEGFETEGIRRREDYKTLGAKMVVKMEQGFKNEQNARRLGQSETVSQGAIRPQWCPTFTSTFTTFTTFTSTRLRQVCVVNCFFLCDQHDG